MTNTLSRRTLVFSAAALLALVPSHAARAADANKHILAFVDTASDMPDSDTLERGIRMAADGRPEMSVDYVAEHVDARRFPGLYSEPAFAAYLREKYRGQQFDLLIGVDDAGIAVADDVRRDLFPGTPLIFEADTNAPSVVNATGLIVRSDLMQTFALAAALQPGLRNVFVVTTPWSDDERIERETLRHPVALPASVTVTILKGLSIDDIQARVSRLPSNSAICVASFTPGGHARSFLPADALDRIAAAANAPMYAWSDADLGHGVVGGSVEDLANEARHLGFVAVRVLSGEPPAGIQVAEESANVKMVDWRQLRRWHLSEDRVPVDATVMFRDEDTSTPAWWRHPAVAVALLMVNAVLLTALLTQRIRRQRAEVEQRQGEQALLSSNARVGNLAGRLIRAQDEERARIARELHDDIGQQVALLSMDLDVLRASGMDYNWGNDPYVRSAWNRATDLARSVHDLSHRTHPTSLESIGLVAALEALRRDLAKQKVTMDLRHSGVPRVLRPGVTVCLYRVVQEAVQNAIKHGGVREVSVDLAGHSDGLTLRIADRGAGFLVKVGWERGLGLRSMRERLDTIRATLDVASAPGAGTSLLVTVPAVPAERRRNPRPPLESDTHSVA